MRDIIFKLTNSNIFICSVIVLASSGFIGISNASAEECAAITDGEISSSCSDLLLDGAVNVLIKSGQTVDAYNPPIIAVHVTGSSNSLTNNGTIFSSGTTSVTVDEGVTLQTFTNNGNIDITPGYTFTFDVYGTIGTLNNNLGATINAIGGVQSLYMEPVGRIDVFNNWGTVTGGSEGIYLDGPIGIINNFGTITFANSNGQAGIGNAATITTLNNAQGSNGALRLYGNLPINYNIIINSNNDYGKLSVFALSTGTATYFGISPSSSRITNTFYSQVLSGIDSVNLNNTSGNFLGAQWHLNNSSGQLWDLIFDSLPVYGPTSADTQASLHSLAPKLRGAFSSQTVATNFANMNTYDCNLFDAKGLCISVGGQQTYVDSSSANMTSAVVVAGYKVSPTFRIGGFLNQNVNNNTGVNVDISNKTPLMGLFAVWNQNENQLGYQVKIANAYQDKDVTTTRDAYGDTGEAGKGKTNFTTQSYVGALSYSFLANKDKTLVRPYAAIRYTSIKQDGYTEDSTVSAPLTYAALEDRSTSALVGIKLNHKLVDKINLTASFGVEQDIYHHVDELIATGVADLTSENFNDNIKRTRPVASIGAYYMPVKNQRIAADVYYQQLPFQSTASTTAYVNYTIGF